MDQNIVTYSRSATVNLSKICTNLCTYCSFPENRLDQTKYELAVPYATIRSCNDAKKKGVKEIRFVSGDRPDSFSAVRARLDLWGFSSFMEYVYTICELVFLEGLIPSVDIGYINEDEMKIIRRMTAAITVMLDSADEKLITKCSPGRTLASRLEVIKYAGEGKVPVTTGFLVGLGETEKSHRDVLEIIKYMHEKYGNIQNVVIQNYIPNDNAAAMGLPTKGPSKKEMLAATELALKILPKDVQVTVPAIYNQDIMPFIKLGVRDLGRIDVNEENADLDQNKFLTTLEKQLKKEGLGLQRRLPIFAKYIAGNWYSRKLAQILDRYKGLLQGAEAVKEAEAEEEDELVVITPKPAKKAKPKTTTAKKKK